MFDTASRNAAQWRAPPSVETSYSANVTDQKSPRGAPGTPNASDASHTSRNDVRQALRQCAPRWRWSYYTLHYSLDAAGRQRASRVEQNARAASHLARVDARRPQLRRATRLPCFLHQCPEHNGSECSPTPPHRRATALHRVPRMYVVRRCRPGRACDAPSLAPTSSTQHCGEARAAPRCAVVRALRRRAAGCVCGARRRLRWCAAFAAASPHVTSHPATAVAAPTAPSSAPVIARAP